MAEWLRGTTLIQEPKNCLQYPSDLSSPQDQLIVPAEKRSWKAGPVTLTVNGEQVLQGVLGACVQGLAQGKTDAGLALSICTRVTLTQQTNGGEVPQHQYIHKLPPYIIPIAGDKLRAM